MEPPESGWAPEENDRNRELALREVPLASRLCHQPFGSRIRSQTVTGGRLPRFFRVANCVFFCRGATVGPAADSTAGHRSSMPTSDSSFHLILPPTKLWRGEAGHGPAVGNSELLSLQAAKSLMNSWVSSADGLMRRVRRRSAWCPQTYG